LLPKEQPTVMKFNNHFRQWQKQCSEGPKKLCCGTHKKCVAVAKLSLDTIVVIH